jgi:hypothetical protein
MEVRTLKSEEKAQPDGHGLHKLPTLCFDIGNAH